MTIPRFSISRARVAFASIVKDLPDPTTPAEAQDGGGDGDDLALASGVHVRVADDVRIASAQDLAIANKLVNLGRKRVEN